MNTSELDYALPPEAIAQHALPDRDRARLLVTEPRGDYLFRDLPRLLDPGDLVIVNRSRVRHARLQGVRRGGGAVEALLLRRRPDDLWEALVKPARKLTAGTELDFGEVAATVVDLGEGGLARLRVHAGDRDVDDALPGTGIPPLPPYINTALDDPERYQTIFAKELGSAAAPTAGLHFTSGVVGDLAERGVGMAEVVLHIGVDTFRPITAEVIEEHSIHTEEIEVGAAAAAAVTETRARGARVVAIGTTVVRALESAVVDGGVAPRTGPTSLFITPGYQFGAVDALVTNFHMPQTSLLALVAAAHPDWKDTYRYALEHGYRFLSFGDAMFIPRLPR